MEIMSVIICERFGWTYYEYMEQPESFINSIIEMMNAEANQQKINKLKNGRK